MNNARFTIHHGIALRVLRSLRAWLRCGGRAGLLAAVVGYLLFLASPVVHAQTYAYRNDVFAYDTPSASATSVAWHTSGASPACTSYQNGDDDWADIAFPGGFAFTFSGTAQTGVRVYSNGILAFPTDVSGFHRDYTSQALPITAAANPGPPGGCTLSAVPTNIMLVYWLDIVAGTANGTAGASIQYELLGTAPNRRFVISWVNVKLYNTTTRYNFQVVLQESLPGVNGNFKYQYTTGSSTGTGATVGVQLTTTDYTQYAYNQNFIDTTVGTSVLWYPANQLAAKAAEYRFDESGWIGSAGEIRDTSGNSRHASRTTAAVLSTPSGKLCRGGIFTANTSNATVDAVATPIVPGNKGSVSFWYKSVTAWNAGSSDRMLFDATTVAASPFFLMKRASGALRFALTDDAGTVRTAQTSTAYSFGANTWQHIAVSWSLKPGTNQTVMQIMLNGVLVNTTGTTPYRTTSSGAIASLSTLYVGDNRTTGVTPATGSPNGANGTLDEVYIYAIDINASQAAADMNLTRPTCTTLDHFHIVHGGEQVSCNGALASITIEAHDVNHNLFSLAGTTMQMSTSTGHGTWSSVATINAVNDTGGGTGNYTFANESSVVLGLTNQFVETLNININSGGITELTGAGATCVAQDYTYGSVCDANLDFADAGFLFSVPNHVSEVSQTVTVSAVKKAGNSPVCKPAFASVSRDVIFTCSYTNPSTGGLSVRVGGKALNAANNAASACDATGQLVTLAFNATGVATTAVQYADVGNMNLNAQYVSGGLTMNGTDTFIAAPASFAFGGVTAAPIKAGSNFTATVTARNNAGAATPNFGKETTAETATLAYAKYQPTGTNSSMGSFSGSVGPFAAGVATATMAWSEVGTIDLSATLASGNYLGSGVTAAVGTTGTTGAVGRFIPHHFDTVLSEGTCADGFSYSGQAFTAKVTAMNGLATPTKTVNYDGGGVNPAPAFAKAVTLSAVGAAGTMTNAAIAANLFSLGVVTVTDSPAFSFATVPSAPTSVALRAVDTDGVSSNGFLEGSTQIRSGRLRLLNAIGPETRNLKMEFEAQHWSGMSFVRNTNDICTFVPASAWSFGNYVKRPAAVVFNPVAADRTLVAGSAFLMIPKPAGGRVTFDASINLAATGAETAASSCLKNLALGPPTRPWAPIVTHPAPSPVRPNLTYLAGRWCDPTDTNNPAARGSFGLYRGAESLIFQRESY